MKHVFRYCEKGTTTPVDPYALVNLNDEGHACLIANGACSSFTYSRVLLFACFTNRLSIGTHPLLSIWSNSRGPLVPLSVFCISFLVISMFRWSCPLCSPCKQKGNNHKCYKLNTTGVTARYTLLDGFWLISLKELWK